MTDYALPTFLKEIPDWVKYKELRFINRYDWIAVLFLAFGCYFLGEWSAFQAWTGMNGPSVLQGFFLPTVLLYHATFSVNSLTHMFGKRNMILGTRVGIIGLYLSSLLERAGTTTITFSGAAGFTFWLDPLIIPSGDVLLAW